MKKSRLPISLVTAFIAAVTMTSCNEVTKSSDAIVTFTGYDGQTINVVTDDMYYDYIKQSSGISKFYDAMLEVLVRYEYQNANSVFNAHKDDTAKSFAQIETEAKYQLVGLKKDAKEKASNNSTDYETEWNKILSEKGVDDGYELLQSLIFNLEKEEIQNWYLRDNEDALLEEYIGLKADGTSSQKDVRSSFPYHIRHILTSISSGSTEYYNGTISKDEALNLYTVAKTLHDGKETFGQLASEVSTDENSAKLYGSLGIMDLSTSFVNEFKLGIYAYDAVYSGKPQNAAIEDGLGISGDYKQYNADGTVTTTTIQNKLDEIGLTYVPYGVFEQLNLFKDVDKDASGHSVNDGKDDYYPRNIYWNKYLNHHNVFVITNNSITKDLATPNAAFDDVGGQPEYGEVDTTIAEAAQGKTGFRYIDGLCQDASQKVLTDEKGNPIVCVRSEHGIHFMIMEKSMYDADLASYYSTAVPGDDDFVAGSYVDYVNTTDTSVYKKRAEDIKTAIKGFDSTYDYRLFEYFIDQEGENIKFFVDDDSNFNLVEAVKSYIVSLREYNVWNGNRSLNDSWNEYIELIEEQNANRVAERLIPEQCALRYANGNTDAEFKEGGACYYAD